MQHQELKLWWLKYITSHKKMKILLYYSFELLNLIIMEIITLTFILHSTKRLCYIVVDS